MSDSIENTDLFDRAHARQLSAEEKAGFNEKLKSDDDFKEAYEAHVKNINLIKAFSARDEIKHIIEESDTPKKKLFKIRYLIPTAVAAAVALTLIFLPQKAIDNQALFDQYFSPYPNVVTSRADESDLQDAMKLYSSRQFEEALIAFSKLEGTEVLFYKSLSLLALGRGNEALPGFKSLRDDQDNRFKEASSWYLGLSYLQIKDNDSAIRYLQLVEPTDSKYQDAKEILKALKR